MMRTGTYREGKRIWGVGSLLFYSYGIMPGWVRDIIRRLILRLEGGHLFSLTIRRIFLKYHKIEIGMYSGPGCFIIDHFRVGTKIGRYTEIYTTAQAFNANHPTNTKSGHSFFFNSCYGFVKQDNINRVEQVIGNDVFIGHNAIILPSVTYIGDGAVISAGAVVNKNVPPYAVVVGNPAREVRYRFPEDMIKTLLQSKWWEKPIHEIDLDKDGFLEPLDGSSQVR
jgi:acetyltransferase-like isoleucine patch superfamily enzyme